MVPLALVCAIAIAIAIAIATPAAATGLFPATFEPLDSPRPPRWSKACDLNGDSEPDIMGVCADSTGNTCVFTRLGLGGGAFGSPQLYVAKTRKPGLYAWVADLNGDGRADMILPCPDSSLVECWLSNSDGSLQPPTITPAPGYTVAVRAGDMNRDGKTDLVVMNGQPHFDLFTLLGHGDGTFESTPASIDWGIFPHRLALADVDGDGNLDAIVSMGAQGYVKIMIGNGDGTFDEGSTLAAAEWPNAVAAADLNGDGRMDIIVDGDDGVGTDVTSVLLAQPGGGHARTDYTMGPGAADLLVADLDGDGHLDIATADARGHDVGMRFGDGLGGFSGRPAFAGPATVLTAADFDHDGRMDLWCERGLLRQTAHRVFGAHNAFPCGTAPVAVAVGDVNSDGVPDVAIANREPGTVTLLPGQGGDGLGSGTAISMGSSVDGVALADLNDDGRLDLVAANHGGNAVTVRLGNGDGSFDPMNSYPVDTEPSALAVADLDGDGILDLAVISDHDSYHNFPNTLFSLPGRGDGTFEAAEGIYAGIKLQRITLADVDGDGRPDAIISSAGGALELALNLGHGTFATPTGFGSGYAAAVGDLDGDGRLDIVGVGSGASVHRGLGGGTFDAPVAYDIGGTGTACALADVDGDGKLDLISVLGGVNHSTESNDVLSVLPGHGDGTFGPSSLMGTEYGPSDIAVADFDGDGWPDIVLPNFQSATVSVLRNRTGLLAVPATGPTTSLGRLVALPNPAGHRVLFRFALAAPARATLVLHDVQGRRIATLLNQALPAGVHEVRWDGRDHDGARVRPGVYYADLATPAGRSVRRVVVIE